MSPKINPLISISLVCSVVGLILIYIAALNLQPRQIKISDITAELVGRSVSTSGKIVYKRSHVAGHLFLTISDNDAKIQVPLFAGFMNSLSEVGLTEKDFKVGDKVSVSGLIDEYRGQLQIIPRKVDDIRILGER